MDPFLGTPKAGGTPWDYCHRCRGRGKCPYYCDHIREETLLWVAAGERYAARRLAEEAQRAWDVVERAEELDALLGESERLERVLGNMLARETALMKELAAIAL